jgi:hypothetical protein
VWLVHRPGEGRIVIVRPQSENDDSASRFQGVRSVGVVVLEVAQSPPASKYDQC